MERKIYQKLLEWKNSDFRKPLILQGARQVGKTYIVNLFAGREYVNYVYCNFEKEKDLVGKMISEGTTPRQLTDLIGSLCDLTSGSGDKGTPIVLVQGYFDNYTNK